MLELAVAGEPRFAVSRVELDRNGPSYTVDTLQLLAGTDDLFLILGSDAIADLPRWKDPDRIARLATLVVADRPGAPERMGDAPVVQVDAPRLDISSRELRARAARGRSLRYLVPDHVWKHIEARRPVPRGGTNVRNDLSSRALADLVVEAAADKKAENILVMNVSEVTSIADLFILCSGRGERQVQAIADGIVEKAKAAGRVPIGVEGYSGGRWILIDLGDVVVHAFVPEERDLYKLERLWGDAPIVLKIE